MTNFTDYETFTDENGMQYEPWTNGYAVGFKCTRPDESVHYVYLNPSSEDSDGMSNVFLYEGPNGDPGGADDVPVIYLDTGVEGDGRADWCIVEDGGIVDRYFTKAEAEQALASSTREGQTVEWCEDPGPL